MTSVVCEVINSLSASSPGGRPGDRIGRRRQVPLAFPKFRVCRSALMDARIKSTPVRLNNEILFIPLPPQGGGKTTLLRLTGQEWACPSAIRLNSTLWFVTRHRPPLRHSRAGGKPSKPPLTVRLWRPAWVPACAGMTPEGGASDGRNFESRATQIRATPISPGSIAGHNKTEPDSSEYPLLYQAHRRRQRRDRCH